MRASFFFLLHDQSGVQAGREGGGGLSWPLGARAVSTEHILVCLEGAAGGRQRLTDGRLVFFFSLSPVARVNDSPPASSAKLRLDTHTHSLTAVALPGVGVGVGQKAL